MTRKPKKVRCWMILRPPGAPMRIRFTLTKDDAVILSDHCDTITPGHFVADAKKARRK